VSAGFEPLSRLRWQCRRGMRELDELLMHYLETGYPAAPPAEKLAFQSLLQLSDPELLGYLLQQQEPPPDLYAVILKLLK